MRLLIVDDEAIIRKGLCETIAWDELQVEVIGEASNGQEAIELLRKSQVDLVLTDIRMPVMDGLELVERIKKEGIHTHVIMISGYDDFEYAVQAMRLGVKDYLLKPVDIEELIGIVKKVYIETIKFEQDSFSRWLLHEMIGTSDVNDFAAMNCLFSKNKPYRVVCSQLSDYSVLMGTKTSDEMKKMGQQMKENIDSCLTKAGFECTSVFIHPNKLITILFIGEFKPYSLVLEKLLELNQHWSGSNKPFFAISQQYSHIEEMKSAYLQASSIMELPIIYQSPVVYYSPPQDNSRPPVVYPLTQIGRLLSYYLEKNREGIIELVEQIFKEFIVNGFKYSEVSSICKKIITILEIRLKELGKSITIKLQFHESPDLLIYNSHQQIQALFIEDLSILYVHISKQSDLSKHNTIMEKAKLYIMKHLFENIKATDVAEYIHVRPNYFSHIFKQDIGKNFNEYVNELRVEKAKELLIATEEKVFEIAEKVGFNDYKHFVYVFKKIAGVTPTIYRENQ